MRISSLFAALVLSLLAACGGAGNSNYAIGGGGGGGTVEVEGLWAGVYKVAGDPAVTVYGAIAKDGYAFFYDTKGILYVLPKFTGSTSVAGTLTSYAPVGLHFEDGSTRQTFQFIASASNSAITGTFTGNGITASFTLQAFDPLNGNPSVVAGNWQGYYVGSKSVFVNLTVQSGGVFAGNDSDGCSITGNIGPHKTGEDIFDVSLDSTGGPLCYGKLSGLAFESNLDAGNLFGGTLGTYYYVAVSSATGGFIAELKVQ